MRKDRILIIDDDEAARRVLKSFFQKRDYEVQTAGGGEEALSLLNGWTPDVILSDLVMADVDGIDILERARRIDDTIGIIIITAFGSVDTAVEAMKKGAFDYITKPIKYDELLILVERAIAQRKLIRENRNLHRALEDRYDFGRIIYRSESMHKLLSIVQSAANTDSTILLQGETGTGKELIARAIHYNSPRRTGPWVAVNCASLAENLLESELFGHERGAFTGAIKQKKGRFELSHGGTLFLDEVGELPPALQVKLLRVLEEKRFERVGGTETVEADFRLICATNRDLKRKMERGEFREDLYYRLHVVPIYIPPLRERKEDIPPLFEYFLGEFCAKLDKKFKAVDPEVVRRLTLYNWPGNVRELKNCIERMVLLCQGDTLTPDHLPEEISPASRGEFDKALRPGTSLGDMERELILRTLRMTRGNKTQTAEILGITRRLLYDKLKRYQIS
ncbi:MAG: sigma-54-dependent transcriptional regulator [bacterium]